MSLFVLAATPLTLILSHGRPHSIAQAPRSAGIALCADADNAAALRQEADRLALLAEKAALEAESLEIKAQMARPEGAAEVAPAAPADIADDEGPMVLSSPLRWIGPYPAVALSFPALSSPAQKARMLQAAGVGGDPTAAGIDTGVTLDFVLDTAANTNTINAQVAGPTSQGGLELEQVGAVAGGVGAGGALGGGATYMLGNCELADAPKEERLVFMSGLTATALPVAAPAAAGLLGVAFLNSFAGGVEFVWGPPPPTQPGAAPVASGDPPTLNLYGEAAGTAQLQERLCSVAVRTLPESALPSVMLQINGVLIPALLDTGSPITVLNAAAAKAAGIGDAPPAAEDVSSNPFTMLTQAFKAGVAATKAETLMVAGANGPVQLLRCEGGATMSLGDADLGGGTCRPYVGELPGLAALDGLGAAAGPAAVLGTDVLRTRPRLWYTPTRIFI